MPTDPTIPQTTGDERAGRRHATSVCEALRARGDKLSLDAAAEIKGTLAAFAVLAADQRSLRERADRAENNQRETMDLWARVPQHIRFAVAHRDRRVV